MISLFGGAESRGGGGWTAQPVLAVISKRNKGTRVMTPMLNAARSICVFALVAPTVAVMSAAAAMGEVVFESGALGPTGLTFADFGGGTRPSGSYVSDFAFTGVRFELIQPALSSRVGGHFVIEPGHDDSFFGAIVRLDSSSDFPDSGDLSSLDVLGQTLLSFPTASTEVFGPLELSLDPGWYALVFGSGQFGATGQGAALANNPDIGSPSYIGHQGGPGWFDFSTLPGPFEDFRLVVEGKFVPEPDSRVIALMTLISLSSFFRKERIQCIRVPGQTWMACGQFDLQ